MKELARAMGKTEAEFNELLPSLKTLGFPMPIEATDDYAVGEVLDWVVEQQQLVLDMMGAISHKFSSSN